METTREMLDRINAERDASNSAVLTALKYAPASMNIVIAYRLADGSIKTVDMGYATGSDGSKKITKKDEDQQFGRGCQRVNDNLLTGATGYVRTPKGIVFSVSREYRSAKLVK